MTETVAAMVAARSPAADAVGGASAAFLVRGGYAFLRPAGARAAIRRPSPGGGLACHEGAAGRCDDRFCIVACDDGRRAQGRRLDDRFSEAFPATTIIKAAGMTPG